MQRLGDLLGSATSMRPSTPATPPAATTPASGAISNPIGLAIECVRRGVVKASESGLIFALGVARRAMRQGKDQLRLFWWLIRRPDRFWCGDDEWAGVRSLLEQAGRSIAQLLRIASAPRRVGDKVALVARPQQGNGAERRAVSSPSVACDRARPIVEAARGDQSELRVHQARPTARAADPASRVEAPSQQVGAGSRFFAGLLKSLSESVELRDRVVSALRCIGFKVEHQPAPVGFGSGSTAT